MSILIKGMEMPKEGMIGIILTSDGKAYMSVKEYEAIELPPHGDLIDRDELELDADWWHGTDGFTAYSRRQIEDAPIVVESEKT